MSFLNLKTGVLIFVDSNVENPKVRLTDVTDTFQQVTVSNVRCIDTVVAPGEQRVIASTQRTLGIGVSTSEFVVSRPVETDSTVRVAWTGTGGNPGFRTARNVAIDSSTHLSLTRIGPRSMKLQSIAGTALDTSSVQVGDVLWFERSTDAWTSPFASINQDKAYTVQSKGTGYVVVNDEGTLGEESDVAVAAGVAPVKIFVAPVADSLRVDDWVWIRSTSSNVYNRGVFQVLRVTDQYVEFQNAYGVAETYTNSVNGFLAFDYMIRFAHIIASGQLELAFDGNATGMTMACLGGTDQAQFTSTLYTTHITATNSTMNPVAVRGQFSGALEG